MYQVIGLRALLRAFTWTAFGLAVLVAAFSLLFEVPSGYKWAQFGITAASTGIAVAMFFFGILGETCAFTWCCRNFGAGIFPDLDGEWVGELRSNWPRVTARGTGDVSEIELLSRPAKIRIKATLLTLSVIMNTDDRYSKSKTIMAGLRKDDVTGEFSLTYVFDNSTLEPKPGDTPSHHGAAILTLRHEGNELFLEGAYWTNRAWNFGINTAGLAKFRKQR
ncbi:Cap15 family cyclic dinucleotide receptor domain-containing protein [Roseococcus pinisoli]|uniref:CD-NTase-associated protein 15 domain-containing protein n=1 Tax=Roseococcus pinisoli TaxID=2835040 RepID=A0ABS5QCJ8_9PROT|nr:hypothetical protein [Roseococcus pinisoli]MBS7811239.1 hypothetical protein [Roseococcus pinisoli]